MSIVCRSAVFFVLLSVFAVRLSPSGTEHPHPLVLYTDVLSGPNTGGENNRGAYLSIFGKNFGEASGLGKVTRVFIGGAEVASYRYLGPSKGRPDIQQLTVQIGSLNGTAAGEPLPVEVRVGSHRSQSFVPQTFTVNPGRMLFVSLTGNDQTAVAGAIDHPWRHVQTSSGLSTGAWGAALPGDTIVVRAGDWTDIGFGNSQHPYFVKLDGNGGTAPKGQRGTGPIAFTTYPGETVTIHPPVSLAYGVFDGARSGRYLETDGELKFSQWITIANFVVTTGGINDGPVNLESGSSHWRVINNDLSAPDAVTNRAAGVTGNGHDEAVLGNHIHDIAGIGSRGETLLDHGIYVDQGRNWNWELAYNVIENITGGNGIQLYSPGRDTATIENIKIHHNWIHGVYKHGLNIGDGSGKGIEIWSNVVSATVAGCWRNNSVYLQDAKIWNNTFYDCNTDPAYPSSSALMNDAKNAAKAISMDFRNNIVVPSTASRRYAQGEVGFTADGVHATGNKNLWFGGNDQGTIAFVSNSSVADPLFDAPSAAMPDFHLQESSPAVSTGDASVMNIVKSNYDLRSTSAHKASINRGAF
jgi:hypothetical protein